ncbi:hypothetical protein FOZ62_014030, partial [Perkinsus olseni]
MTALNGLSDFAGFVLAHHYRWIMSDEPLGTRLHSRTPRQGGRRIKAFAASKESTRNGPVLILTVSAASSGLFVCGLCPTDLNPTHARITVLKLAGSRLTSRGPASYLNQLPTAGKASPLALVLFAMLGVSAWIETNALFSELWAVAPVLP